MLPYLFSLQYSIQRIKIAFQNKCKSQALPVPFLCVDVGLETGSYLYKMAAAVFTHPITAGLVARLSADSLHTQPGLSNRSVSTKSHNSWTAAFYLHILHNVPALGVVTVLVRLSNTVKQRVNLILPFRLKVQTFFFTVSHSTITVPYRIV